MKVTFILPAIGKKPGQHYIRTWQTMEPLTISTLKALTPGHVETEFFDDRIELVDYETTTDLVAISVEIYTARRAYMIAARFRARGVLVILGGYHTTLNPEEAAEHADSILTGNAEGVWAGILDDLATGTLQARYRGGPEFKDVLPDRSIFAGKKYSKMGVVETGRGCNFGCEFCAITAFHKARYYRKTVEQVVADVKHARDAGKTIFFFADDNIVADQNYAIELFQALTPLKIQWTGQGTLTMARNDELLYWMAKSGCKVILIGYESLSEANLKQMNKAWSAKLGEVDHLTEKIHKVGMNIYATFVFGFDDDSRELYDRTVDFALKHRFYFAAFNHLLTLPGTDIYSRLLSEGKIIQDKWWLSPDYRYGDITFTHPTFTPQQLTAECRRARKRFYSLPNIFLRSGAALRRSKSLWLYGLYWYLNLKLQEEVDGKLGLPMGDGLDEMPK
jgi:radical SAM superfamily enzyme YgiQ (UPF0313 family)